MAKYVIDTNDIKVEAFDLINRMFFSKDGNIDLKKIKSVLVVANKLVSGIEESGTLISDECFGLYSSICGEK